VKALEFHCTNCHRQCFLPRRSNTARFFCSVACSTEWRRENPVRRHTCFECGTRFGGRSRRARSQRKFCSRKCWDVFRRKEGARQTAASAERRAQKAKEYQKAWFQRNKDRKCKQGSAWRKKNRAKAAAMFRKWKAKHPTYDAIRSAIRKARKTGAGGSFTEVEWQDLKKLYDHRCLCCGRSEPSVRLEPDHVIPVTRGGHSKITNIQPLCRSCNARKGNHNSIDYRENAALANPA
jgi:5-methylcytosine-specific restriction endonuclease McrA